MTSAAWGVLSGVLDAVSFAVMIQPVAWPRAGKRRQAPARLSWLVWAGLYQVMFWASAAAGARGSLWIVAVEAAGTAAMLGLSLRWGRGTLAVARVSLRPRLTVAVESWPDLLVVLGAAAALAGWQLTSSASAGVVLSVATDSLAALPLVTAAWRDPLSSSLLGWASTGLASLAAVPSVTSGQPVVLYAYPVSGVVLDTAIAAVLLAARRRPASPAGAQTI